MLFYLILFFTIIPIAEIYVLIKVGQHIGALNTVMIVVFIGLLGIILFRLEGLRVLYGVQRDLQEGKMPAGRLLDGLLILVGAILLIIPGLLTDIAGFILIIPFTRFFIKILLRKKLQNMIDKKQGVINVRSYRYGGDYEKE
ncbi:MAG: FxsA family protein [Candidatus Omnitrophica bacterium]|nr:FxsA family protein [Candidatus Omnitrophota bacterium]MDD5351961.1 FxsA family protein [Candidatus Omnitrophota bacterium]MDD5550787.1 FxsA family protein [Candidatus Omnitrophota bacterium]